MKILGIILLLVIIYIIADEEWIVGQIRKLRDSFGKR